ncbi:MAG: hypothetical protein HZC47_03630 [Methanobacterium sp.]|nr:hypothetical protein [Methanobacterium sp.]
MSYYPIPISLILIILYLISFVLYKEKEISKGLHVRIWNIVLLISFIISVCIGLILIGFREFGLATPFSLEMLFWHIETGLALLVIAVFHIVNYWKSFKKFRVKKRKTTKNADKSTD